MIDSCESCGRDAVLIPVLMPGDAEPFHVCRRCAAASHVPQRLPFPTQREDER